MLLRTEYFWLAVNVLKNSPEILPITKEEFFEINCLHSDEKIRWKGCHWDFSTFWSSLPCCLSKSPLKRDFLDIYVTTFYGIGNLGNRSVLRLVFSLKVFKILSTFQKFRKNNWEKAFCFLDNCIWIGCVN